MNERHAGFSLIELVIAVAIVGILAAIAYPSYINSITNSNRAAARACLANFATHMERFYTTNMRYDEDLAGDAVTLPGLDCASDQNTGENYDYDFAAGQPTQTSFTLEATPKGTQASRDTECGTLTLTQTGARGASGSGGVTRCW